MFPDTGPCLVEVCDNKSVHYEGGSSYILEIVLFWHILGEPMSPINQTFRDLVKPDGIRTPQWFRLLLSACRIIRPQTRSKVLTSLLSSLKHISTLETRTFLPSIVSSGLLAR
jgi:hypothetical protein